MIMLRILMRLRNWLQAKAPWSTKKKFTISLNVKNTGPKPITELRPTYEDAVDLRGEAIEVCICGCFIWNIKAAFEDNEMSYYYTDMECANCGSLATAPPLKPSE